MSLDIGSVVQGTVVGITNFGAFIELPDGATGLVHISEISNEYVKKVQDFLTRDDKVEVKIIGKNKKGKYDLSIKQVKTPVEEKPKVKSPRKSKYHRDNSRKFEPKPAVQQSHKSSTFEDKLAQFLKDSEQKQLDIKKKSEPKRKKGRFNR